MYLVVHCIKSENVFPNWLCLIHQHHNCFSVLAAGCSSISQRCSTVEGAWCGWCHHIE